MVGPPGAAVDRSQCRSDAEMNLRRNGPPERNATQHWLSTGNRVIGYRIAFEANYLSAASAPMPRALAGSVQYSILDGPPDTADVSAQRADRLHGSGLSERICPAIPQEDSVQGR